MNIFYLSEDPEQCAKWHCDKHVLKMIIEYAQLLSTAHRMLDGEKVKVLSNSGKQMVTQYKLNDYREDHLYKCAHINHPSNIWVRSSKDHYLYTMELWNSLNREYTNRYGKVHETFKKLCQYLNQLPNNIDKNVGFQLPPQCMPDECKIVGTNDPVNNTIQAYREFYKAHKREFATWKNEVPPWFN
tara:strand:- start:88 stop:645 length:558 start_codon:yes stop_codon:yes gene_type:complete